MAQQESQTLSPSNFARGTYPTNQRFLSKREVFPPPPSPPIERNQRLLHHLLIQNKNSSPDVEMCCVTRPDRDSPDRENRDDESENTNEGATTTGKKKGKAQKFFCDDFPPCNLSFTRSEHLARHIRKHTGERPFQCHCSRRFSRLDNLRQHAQTVHQNEEIPEDSLAATGTRFQRQVRNTMDKSRPTGGRARGNTVGSQATPINRVHKRNSLSTSSIGSVSSYSSNQTIPDRKRPHPLILNPSTTTSNEYASRNGGIVEGAIGNKPLQEPLSSAPQNLSGSHISIPPSHPSHLSSSPIVGSASASLTARSNDSVNTPWIPVPGLQSPPRSSHSRTASDSPWSHLPTPSGPSSVPIPLRTPNTSSSTPSLSSSSSSSHSMHLSTLLSDGPVNVPSPSLHLHPGTNSSPTTEPTQSLVWTLRETNKEPDEVNRRRTWHFDSNMSMNLTPPHPAPRILKHMNHHHPLDPKLYPPPISISSSHPPQSSSPPSTAMRLPGIESFGPLETSQPPSRHESNIFHILESPSPSLWSTQSKESRHLSSHSPQLDHVINRNMNRLELNGQEAINSWILDHQIPLPPREKVELLTLPILRQSPCHFEYPEINTYHSPLNMLQATCRK